MALWVKVWEVQRPLSRQGHNCRAFRIAIAPRQTLYKFVYRRLPIFLVRLSDHPRYLIRGTVRAFVTSWVAMFIFVFLRPAEPYSGLRGKVIVYSTLPLGWKGSAYGYHTTGLLATSYIIFLGVHPIPNTSVIVVQARLWFTRRSKFQKVVFRPSLYVGCLVYSSGRTPFH